MRAPAAPPACMRAALAGAACALGLLSRDGQAWDAMTECACVPASFRGTLPLLMTSLPAPARRAAVGRRLEARSWASSTEPAPPRPQQRRYRMEPIAAAAAAGAAGHSCPPGVATAAARMQRASTAMTAGAAGPVENPAGWL